MEKELELRKDYLSRKKFIGQGGKRRETQISVSVYSGLKNLKVQRLTVRMQW